MRFGKAAKVKPLPSVTTPKMGAAPVMKPKKKPGLSYGAGGAGAPDFEGMARMMAAGGQL